MNSPIFQRFASERLSLTNRIIMAPMTRRRSPGGVPSPDVVRYYRARAAGGVGLILTEGIAIDRPAASFDSNVPVLDASASVAAWRDVVNAVHAEGGKIGAQFWHAGLQRADGAGPHPKAPSEGPSKDGSHTVEMSDEDIADTIEAFAKAAVTAQGVGFDAIEIHGAHGYLIDQFIWQSTNRRTDKYGGTSIERMRFAAEIIRAVRERVGPGFAISFRFSQWKLQDYGARIAQTPDELEAVLAPIVDAGSDLLHPSTRRFWEPEFPNSDLGLAGWTRKLTGLPTIAVGSVGLSGGDVIGAIREGEDFASVAGLDALEKRMSDGEFDLVAVGRALLSNPAWPNLVKEGRHAELRPFDKSLLATL
ncbi:NADH:flavin oxidoreductase [Paraburkholderia caribensis]|uniref:NADH:flavin oxidoreductase n=1 Tax=Paraburkholderia caribensis TaxID=75105 RepID=UPI0034D29467